MAKHYIGTDYGRGIYVGLASNKDEVANPNKLTRYNEILQEARTKTNEARNEFAKHYVPMLYTELMNQAYEPFIARVKVEKDCKSIYVVETIRKFLPDEAKDATKAESGRKATEVKKAKRLSIKKYKILLSHQHISEILYSNMHSEDGSVWLYANSTYDYLSSEPGKPKAVTPIQVPTSSAPVRTT